MLIFCHHVAPWSNMAKASMWQVSSSAYEGNPLKGWERSEPNTNAFLRRSGVSCSHPTSLMQGKDEWKEGKPDLPQKTKGPGLAFHPSKREQDSLNGTSSWKRFVLSKLMFHNTAYQLSNINNSASERFFSWVYKSLKKKKKKTKKPTKTWQVFQAATAMPAEHIHLTSPSSLWSCLGQCFDRWHKRQDEELAP